MARYSSGRREDPDRPMAANADHLDDTVTLLKQRVNERYRKLIRRTEELTEELRHDAEEMHRESQQDLDLLQNAIDFVVAPPDLEAADAAGNQDVDSSRAPEPRPSPRPAADPVPGASRSDSLPAIREIRTGDEDSKGRASVYLDGCPPVVLSRQDRTLLTILAEDTPGHLDAHDRCVPYKTREQVLASMQAQWNEEFQGSALNAAVWRLRFKLRKRIIAGEKFVQTRHRYGYRFRKVR